MVGCGMKKFLLDWINVITPKRDSVVGASRNPVLIYIIFLGISLIEDFAYMVK